jgi:putative nucleotidyltransferase with HDIG domain
MSESDWFVDEQDALLTQVIGLLRQMDTPAYLVGGTVRDRLLAAQEGSETREAACDLDFAVPGDGVPIARRIADALGAAFYPLDAGRGVGRVVLTGSAPAPASALEAGRGRTGSQEAEREAWGVRRVVDVSRFQGPDLEADLAGRDFTINAMAVEVTRDTYPLVDPHAGQADLRARRLRAVSDRAMQNDPIRGLRAVRLRAGLGFQIEPRTQALIRAAAPRLLEASAERIRDELLKILRLPGAASSLRELDALELLAPMLPEVTALKGVQQTGLHRWGVYEHTLQVVAALELLLPFDGPPHPDLPCAEQVSEHLAAPVSGGQDRRTLLTLAALLHDVGKPATASVEPDGRIRFIDHERIGARMAGDALRRLRFSADAARLMHTIVRHHMRPLHMEGQASASWRAIHRFFRDAGDAGVDIALLSLADHLGTVGFESATTDSLGQVDGFQNRLAVVRTLLDAHFHRQQSVVAPLSLLTGRDLMSQFGLAEGPSIGRLLAALREAQAAGEVETRAQAEEWMRRRLESG